MQSFFAMPFFDWRIISAPFAARPNICFYFAFVVPLTRPVLGDWAARVKPVTRTHDREDEKVVESCGSFKDRLAQVSTPLNVRSQKSNWHQGEDL